MNFQMFKLVLEKAEEPDIKLPTSTGSSKKQEFLKNIYFCFIDYTKFLDFVDYNNYIKFFKLSFKSMWTKNFQMFKLDIEEAEETEIKLPISVGP